MVPSGKSVAATRAAARPADGGAVLGDETEVVRAEEGLEVGGGAAADDGDVDRRVSRERVEQVAYRVMWGCAGRISLYLA